MDKVELGDVETVEEVEEQLYLKESIVDEHFTETGLVELTLTSVNVQDDKIVYSFEAPFPTKNSLSYSEDLGEFPASLTESLCEEAGLSTEEFRLLEGYSFCALVEEMNVSDGYVEGFQASLPYRNSQSPSTGTAFTVMAVLVSILGSVVTASVTGVFAPVAIIGMAILYFAVIYWAKQ